MYQFLVETHGQCILKSKWIKNQMTFSALEPRHYPVHSPTAHASILPANLTVSVFAKEMVCWKATWSSRSRHFLVYASSFTFNPPKSILRTVKYQIEIWKNDIRLPWVIVETRMALAFWDELHTAKDRSPQDVLWTIYSRHGWPREFKAMAIPYMILPVAG